MATKMKVDKAAIRKANETALKGFPKSMIRKAFETMANEANNADAASESKAAAALHVCELAEQYVLSNEGHDQATVMTGWRDNLAVLVMELAVSGNKFAELKPGDGDKPATAKLTGYGNNVASIAKGVIEFGCFPSTIDDVSYRAVRKAVEASRKAARDAADPDAAALAAAKEACVADWDALRTAVFETGDAGLVRGLAGMLQDALAEFESARAEQDAVEAEAA